MKNIVIIDGQGGRIGCMLISGIKEKLPAQEITAVGSNTIATTAMLKAGADHGATGENPVIYNSSYAEIIAGPIGLLAANSLYGEITPKMALAIGESRAKKILIPIGKCNLYVAGTVEMSFPDYISQAVDEIARIINED